MSCGVSYACRFGSVDLKAEYFGMCTTYMYYSNGAYVFGGSASVEENALVTQMDSTTNPPEIRLRTEYTDYTVYGVNLGSTIVEHTTSQYTVEARCLLDAEGNSSPNFDVVGKFTVTPSYITRSWWETKYNLVVRTTDGLNYEECKRYQLKLRTELQGTHYHGEAFDFLADCMVTLDVVDMNDRPVFVGKDFQDGYARSVPEMSEPGTPVGDPVLAEDEDVGQDLYYHIIAGNDEGWFSISLCSGQLFVAKNGLDYETMTTPFNLTIRVNDVPLSGPSLTDTTWVVVTLTNVNEAPHLVLPPGALNHTWYADENTASIRIARAIQGQAPNPDGISIVDEDGDPLTYTVTVRSGPDLGAVVLEASGPNLWLAHALDYEALGSGGTIRLNIYAEDPYGLGLELDEFLQVINLNDPPVFTADVYRTAALEDTENIVLPITLQAVDPDAGTVVQMSILAGNEDGVFVLNRVDDTSFGLKLASGQKLNFESTSPLYSLVNVQGVLEVHRNLVVMADDQAGANTTAQVVVKVININEPPKVMPAYQVRSMSELTTPGQAFGLPLNATDPEMAVQLLFWSVSFPDPGCKLDVDPVQGLLFPLEPMDYETGVRNCTGIATVTDTQLDAQGTVSVLLIDENEPPELVVADYYIAENSLPGNATAPAVVNVSDPDAHDAIGLHFAPCQVTSADAEAWRRFELGGNGSLQVSAAVGQPWDGNSTKPPTLDYERQSDWSLCVNVSDNLFRGVVNHAALRITVHLLDVNEPPAASDATVVIPEQTAAGTLLPVALAAEDPEGDDLSWSANAAVAGVLSLSHANLSAPLQLKVLTNGSLLLQAEAPLMLVGGKGDKTWFTTSVTVQETGTPDLFSDSTTLTVGVENKNQPPTNVSADNIVTVPEDAISGFVFGGVSADDADVGDVVTYQLLQVTPAAWTSAFKIYSSTGVLAVVDSADLDYEALPTGAKFVTLRVAAVDSNSPPASTEITFTVPIGDVNEPPSLDAVTCTVNEQTAGLICKLTGSDPEGASVTFLEGWSSGVTFIQIPSEVAKQNNIVAAGLRLASDGKLSLANADLDYEVLMGDIQLRLRVSDGSFEEEVQQLVTVVNVNEAPRFACASGEQLQVDDNSRASPTRVASQPQASNSALACTGFVSDLLAYDPDAVSDPGTFGAFTTQVIAVRDRAGASRPDMVPIFSVITSTKTGSSTADITREVLTLANGHVFDYEAMDAWEVDLRIMDTLGLNVTHTVAIEVQNKLDAVVTAFTLETLGGVRVAQLPTQGGSMRIQGLNLQLSSQLLAYEPAIAATLSVVPDLHGQGSIPAYASQCTSNSSTELLCPLRAGVGAASATLSLTQSHQMADSPVQHNVTLRWDFQLPALSSVAVPSSSIDSVPTEPGVPLVLTGTNFGPALGSTAPAVYYNVSIDGSALREALTCSVSVAHTQITCTTASASGAARPLLWMVKVGGQPAAAQFQQGKLAAPVLSSVTLAAPASSDGTSQATVVGQHLGAEELQLLFNHNAQGAARYITPLCTAVVQHQRYTCAIPHGSGTGHSTQVLVGSDANGRQLSSVSLTQTVSYAAPSMAAANAVLGAGAIRASTTGGEAFMLLGSNFGAATPGSQAAGSCSFTVDTAAVLLAADAPTGVQLAPYNAAEQPLVYYGPASWPLRYQATDCRVMLPDGSLLQCCSAPGTGKGFVYTVVVQGQQAPMYNASLSETGYHPPVLMEEREVDSSSWNTSGAGMVTLTGRHFGFLNSDINNVTYGRDSNTEFTASCVLLSPHVQLQCAVAEGAGAGMTWAIEIGQQLSEAPSTSYGNPQIARVTGPGENLAPPASTLGGQTVLLHGQNFGPKNFSCAYGYTCHMDSFVEYVKYGPTAAEYTATCSLLSHQLMNCTTQPGSCQTGMQWSTSVAGQKSGASALVWGYGLPNITALSVDNRETRGGGVLAVTGQNFATRDVRTKQRLRWMPFVDPVSNVRGTDAKVVSYSLDVESVEFVVPPGFNYAEFQVETVMSTAAGGQCVEVSGVQRFTYAPPVVQSARAVQNTQRGGYDVTILGSSFARNGTVSGNPVSVVRLITSSGQEFSTLPGATNPLYIDAWDNVDHSSIQVYSTALQVGTGNVTVGVLSSLSPVQYTWAPLFAFENTMPVFVEMSADDVTAGDLHPTAGGSRLVFRMDNIDNSTGALRVNIGRQYLGLGERASCSSDEPCLITRNNTECTHLTVESVPSVLDALKSVFRVSCTLPPGQGLRNEIAVKFGSLRPASAIWVGYSAPTIQHVAATDAYTSVAALTSGAMEVTVTTRGASLDVFGLNFGYLHYFSLGQTPGDVRRGLQPGGARPDFTIGGPVPLLDYQSPNHTATSISLPALVHKGGPVSGGLGRYSLHMKVGVDLDVADEEVKQKLQKSADKYGTFFDLDPINRAVGHSPIVLLVAPPTMHAVSGPGQAAPQELLLQTAGGEVITIQGTNFGQSSTHLPVVTIGGAPCALLANRSMPSGGMYPRVELDPLYGRDPHSTITCITPEGVGKDVDVSVSVGDYVVTNRQAGGSSVTISYRPPTLFAMSPRRGPTAGGTIITLLGDNFGKSSDTGQLALVAHATPDMSQYSLARFCALFDETIPVQGVQSWSHTRVVLQLPAGQGHLKQMLMTVAGQPSSDAAARTANDTWPVQMSTTFMYNPPNITKVSGSGLCSTQGCDLVLHGENFGMPITRTVAGQLQRCQPVVIDTLPSPQFCLTEGNQPGRVRHSHDHINCILGEGLGRDRNVTVSISGRSFTAALFSYAPPATTGVTPNTLDARGGSGTILIDGVNFGPIRESDGWAANVSVLFDDEECANAKVFTPHKAVTCDQVPGVVGPKQLEVQLWVEGAVKCAPGAPTNCSRQLLSETDPFTNSRNMLQYVCEYGFYGQVGEYCLDCPLGALCDFSGRADCVHRAADATCLEYNEPIAAPTFWLTYKSGDNVLCDDLRRVRPYPWNGSHPIQIANGGGVCPALLICDPPEACLGNNTCGAGYRNKPGEVRCPSCALGYYRFNGECKKCPDQSWMLPLFFAIGITVICGLGFWMNKKNINLALMSVSVDYLQVIALFARSRIKWPAMLKDLFSYLSVLNFNLDLTAPECALPNLAYWQKWAGIMSLPIMVAVGFALYVLIGYLYKRFIKGQSGMYRMDHLPPVTGAYLTLSYFMYLYVSRTVLDVFNCSQRDPPDDWPYGYMAAEPIPCFQPGGIHEKLYYWWAWIFLFCYVLAYPGVVGYVLYTNQYTVKLDQLLRANGVGDSLQTSIPKVYNFRRMFHKIYYHFKPAKFFWISVIITRKFFIAVTALLFKQTPAYQLALCVLVLFISYALQVKNSPYMSMSERRAVALTHDKEVREGNQQHMALDEQLRDILRKAQTRGTKVTMASQLASQQNHLDVFITNYNTVEVLLLCSAILVALSGVMFDSRRFAEGKSQDGKLALTILVMVLICVSLVYIVCVFWLEVYQHIRPDAYASFCGRMVGKVGNPGKKSAIELEEDERKAHEIAAPAKLGTMVNPLMMKAQAIAGADDMGVMNEVFSRELPPDPATWAAVRGHMTTQKDKILEMNERMRTAKRAASIYKAMTHASKSKPGTLFGGAKGRSSRKRVFKQTNAAAAPG